MSVNKHIIEVQTRGADKSKRQINGVSNGLKNMAKQASIAAAAYFGSQALLGAIKSSIELFGKQEEAEKKLRFAAGAATNELIKQAEAIQRNSRFGDEAVIAQQAYVKSLGISTEQTKEIISASVDLAAAMNISLESAVMNTTKTLSGMQGELGEKLPAAFKELTPEALKAGEGIKFIAEQFSGTAQADAESMSGQIDQMKNAVGDAGEAFGELLAPAIIVAADGIKFLANQLISLFTWQERLAEQYNQQFKILTDQEVAMRNLRIEVQTMTESNIIDRLREMGVITENVSDAQFLAAVSSGEFARAVAEASALQTEESDALEIFLERLMQLQANLDSNTDSYRAFVGEKLLKIEQDKLEAELNDKFIKQYPELAKTIGMVTTAEKQQQMASQSTRAGLNQMVSDLQVAGGEFGKFQKIAKAAAIAQTTFDTYESASSAYKSFLENPMIPAPLNMILATTAATTATIAGLARVQSIRKAQYGADFVTDGPQMMMVGEGSGPERVQVTPLSDPNIDGPQGQGIVLNIQGNVLHESFVEDNIIPQIREGLRLGENMGI